MDINYSEKQIKDMTSLHDYHNEFSHSDHVIIKVIEELSSLNKLLAKLLLEEIKPHDIELLDELFDADFMMFQLKRMLIHNEYIRTLYDNVVNSKLERELKRWGLVP